MTSLMTTELGWAASCSRAAMFGVSPTMASASTVSPPPISPATTSPVWMPMRTPSSRSLSALSLMLS